MRRNAKPADARVVAPSGLPAPHGVGAWGGRRLLYRGDAELEKLTNRELHVVLLDLRVRASRSRADREGRPLDRASCATRAAKTEAMAAAKAVAVARNMASIHDALSSMKGAVPPIEISFSTVADALSGRGCGLDRTTLYRRPEYAAPIWASMGIALPDDAALKAAEDPEYARIAGLTKAELVEEIRRARKEAREEEARLAEELSRLA